VNKALVAAIAALSKEEALEFRRRLRNSRENHDEIKEEIIDQYQWKKQYGKMVESR
jgi:hypothetical protein